MQARRFLGNVASCRLLLLINKLPWYKRNKTHSDVPLLENNQGQAKGDFVSSHPSVIDSRTQGSKHQMIHLCASSFFFLSLSSSSPSYFFFHNPTNRKSQRHETRSIVSTPSCYPDKLDEPDQPNGGAAAQVTCMGVHP